MSSKWLFPSGFPANAVYASLLSQFLPLTWSKSVDTCGDAWYCRLWQCYRALTDPEM